MNLVQVECLVEVVRFGSYDRAAEVLHLSSSAVAKNVKKMEDEFGVSLMSREGRRSFPTPVAMKIVDKASDTLQAFRDFEHCLESLASDAAIRGPVRVAVSGSRLRSCCFREEDFSLFSIENDDFDFRYSRRPNETCFTGLQSGAFDIAVTLGDRAMPSVSYRRIGTLTAMVKVSKAHHLAKKASLSFSDLEGQNIAEPDDFAFVRSLIHSRLISGDISASFIDIPFSASSCKSFVASGGMILVGPQHVLFDDEVVLPFEEKDAVSFPVFLAWRDYVPQNLVDSLGAFLTRVFAEKGIA